MKLGLFLSSQYEPSADLARGVESTLEQARLAEELGFDSLFVGHHYLARSAFLQPTSLLAHLAAVTQRIRLGFGVLLAPLWNPVVLAEELATIDVLSGGRLVAGLGTGYREVEYQATGVDFAQRYRRLERDVGLLRELWSGQPVVVDEPDVQLRSVQLNLSPVQPGGPPIWLGAFGPVGIRRAARLDTVWLMPPSRSPNELAELLATFRSHLDDLGLSRQRPYPVMREAFVAPSRAEAVELAGPYLEAQYAGYRNWQHGLDLEGLLDGPALVGSPDDVVRQLEHYRDHAGVTDVIVRTGWMGMDDAPVKRSIELLGAEVLPRLGDSR